MATNVWAAFKFARRRYGAPKPGKAADQGKVLRPGPRPDLVIGKLMKKGPPFTAVFFQQTWAEAWSAKELGCSEPRNFGRLSTRTQIKSIAT